MTGDGRLVQANAEVEVLAVDDFLNGFSDADVNWLVAEGDPKHRRKLRNAEIARAHRMRKKMKELRSQVKALTRRLHELRTEVQAEDRVAFPAQYADAIRMQLSKRRMSEKMNEQLRRMLAAQRGFALEMSTALLSHRPPAFGLELDMRALLHTYTRLGRRPDTRYRDFLAACSSDKLDLAVRLVLRETKALSALTPTLRAQQITGRPGELATTTTCVYSVESLEVARIVGVARDTILNSPHPWPGYSLVADEAKLLESPTSHIQYLGQLTEYTSGAPAESILLESRSLSYYRVSDTCAALVWDFIDRDDLHPLHPATRLSCNTVGAIVIRREACEDYVERIVCRALSTKIHIGNLEAADIARYSQPLLRDKELCTVRIFNQIVSGV